MSDKQQKTILVTDRDWLRVRTQFSEDEKRALQKASLIQVNCPLGVVLDEEMLPEPLAEKIKAALATESGV